MILTSRNTSTVIFKELSKLLNGSRVTLHLLPGTIPANDLYLIAAEDGTSPLGIIFQITDVQYTHLVDDVKKNPIQECGADTIGEYLQRWDASHSAEQSSKSNPLVCKYTLKKTAIVIKLNDSTANTQSNSVATQVL